MMVVVVKSKEHVTTDGSERCERDFLSELNVPE